MSKPPKKWTKWMKIPYGANVIYGNEVVKMKEGDDGEIYYKRLRANVEGESARTSKLSGKFDKAPPEPTPIITGPGEYKTRDGRKVEIRNNSEFTGTFQGSISEPRRILGAWRPDGRHMNIAAGSKAAIIGPWEEPEAEPEQWQAVYRDGEGKLFLAGLRSSENDIETQNEHAANFIGALKLTKGEG